MKLLASLTFASITSLLVVACDKAEVSHEQSPADAAAEASPEAAEPQARNHSVVPAGTPLSEGAPGFATLYPGAEMVKPALTAVHAGRHGGIAEFTTGATAEAVIEHYRDLASSDGLQVTMQLDQGNARAFSARSVDGAELQVVASPVEDGETAVQLTWQAD